MKRNGQIVKASSIGSRQANMNKSFSVAIRSLLSACSKQDVFEAFPSFTASERERLYRIYIQVVASLHGSMEDAFKTVCLETQIGTALNTVEQLVEEQELDPLRSEKTNVMDVAQNISTAKRNEVENLTKMLQMAEKQNQLLRARVEAFKKGAEDASVVSDIVETVRRGNANYALHSSLTDTHTFIGKTYTNENRN